MSGIRKMCHCQTGNFLEAVFIQKLTHFPSTSIYLQKLNLFPLESKFGQKRGKIGKNGCYY